MRITISNFGPIKECDFDFTKPLVGIFGKNSLGKSYAISIMYLIIKDITEINDRLFVKSFYPTFMLKNMDNLISDLENGSYPTENIEQFLKENFSKIYTNALTESFSATFGNLATLQNHSSNEKPTITLYNAFSVIEFTINDDKLEINTIKLKKNITLKFIVSNGNGISKIDEVNDQQIELHVEKDDEIITSNNIVSLVNLFIEKLQLELINCGGSYIYYLPASRSGLYQALSTLSQTFATLSLKQNSLDKPISLPSLSKPVSDYFLNLSQITTNIVLFKDDIDKIIKPFENNILKGSVSFDDNNKKIRYQPNNLNTSLDISFASSMISEISPVIMYLKYLLLKNENTTFKKQVLIFIEEPEAHLHPEVQVELAHLFSQLVKLTSLNINIVITSHSNYIFNKLSNLVLSKELSVDQVRTIVFYETNEGSVARDSQIDELGIDDDNFLDIAEKLYEEKLELIEKLNEES